jgi:hypothetical protein
MTDIIDMQPDTLYLLRKDYHDTCTIGELWYCNYMYCFTLEDKVRPNKIPKHTAIPAGTYDLSLTMSPKFKRILPILHKVPNFEGIRIHKGNNATHTDGCVLVGFKKGDKAIYDSAVAESCLIDTIKLKKINKIKIIDSKAV